MSKIQVVILAGGQGSRLRPYTAVIPKPLMPVGQFPIAEVIIRQLKKVGLTHIAISTGHLAGLIEAYFGNGRRWGVKITYLHEDRPLGTAGALKLVKNMQDDCLVINGDILTDISFKELLRYHLKHKAMATISVKERIVKTDFGMIETNQHNQLVDYIEKPEYRSFVSMGIYVVRKQCQDYISQKKSMGMPELILKMKEDDLKINCFKTKALWLDLGRLDDFELAQDIFSKNIRKFIGH